jgi:hypothetical protein
VLYPDEMHHGRAGTEGGFGYRIVYVRRLDAAERPAEPAQRQDLLLLVVAQDVGHVGGETTVPSPPSTSWGAATSLAGFQVSMTGRFGVSTEVISQTPI